MGAQLKGLLAGERVLRVFALGQLCHPKLVEMVGWFGGFDAVWLDHEHAGLSTAQVEEAARAARGCGLDSFVRLAATDYAAVINEHGGVLDGYTASGNSHSILANRVSFLLNLRGPSAPIDTACSSSLIALHRAIESIHTGSCDMAIVGGVQVMLSPAAYISFSAAGMLSPDGKCKTFDKQANGYVQACPMEITNMAQTGFPSDLPKCTTDFIQNATKLKGVFRARLIG